MGLDPHIPAAVRVELIPGAATLLWHLPGCTHLKKKLKKKIKIVHFPQSSANIHAHPMLQSFFPVLCQCTLFKAVSGAEEGPR